MLAVERLSKTYLAEDGRCVQALQDVSLHCAKGEFVCVLGPTGCGKTTLLRSIAGLEAPTGGTVRVDASAGDAGGHGIGYVFQQNALFPWRNVLENVMFGLQARGWTRADAVGRSRECLERVGLRGVETSYPYELSGGMQQRVSIARAIAPSPSVLLMDEPFGSVDERSRHALQRELLRLWERSSLTIVFVTHGIEEAVYLGQRVVVMKQDPGSILGELRIALGHPRDRMSGEFVEGLLKVRALFERQMI